MSRPDFVIPVMNANSPDRWEEDRVRARDEIVDWLAITVNTEELRNEYEGSASEALDLLRQTFDISKSIRISPQILPILRSWTRRDIGTSQFATFVDLGESVLRQIEASRKAPPEDFIERAGRLIEIELDYGLLPWLKEKRSPSTAEQTRATVVAADRILRRRSATNLRYLHEPRQLTKLADLLDDLDYREHKFSQLVDPLHDVPPGTYSFRCNVSGLTSEGLELKQNVDVLIKPHKADKNELPIFVEAKSMTDEVNPNKRQKEEAQKVNNLKRMWEMRNPKPVVYVLLLGGTVPRRYLEVEAGSGLDWVWEHRVEDLRQLLDAY